MTPWGARENGHADLGDRRAAFLQNRREAHRGYPECRRPGDQRTVLQREPNATSSSERRLDGREPSGSQRLACSTGHSVCTNHPGVWAPQSDRHSKVTMTFKHNDTQPPHGEASSSWGVSAAAAGSPSWKGPFTQAREGPGKGASVGIGPEGRAGGVERRETGSPAPWPRLPGHVSLDPVQRDTKPCGGFMGKGTAQLLERANIYLE